MGGKSGGGSFVEQGTPLSQEAIASRTNAQNLARQKEQQKERNDGNSGPRGYEGAEVDSATAAAIGAGIAGGFIGAVTGGVPGAVVGAYQGYTSMEDGILGDLTGYGKKDQSQTDDRGFFGSLSDAFGSLLGDDDDDGSGSSSSSGAGIGGVSGADMGKGSESW